jgi:lipopolysaccharide export system protein LptA
MPISIRRLRYWFLGAAVLVAAVAAGFYFYAKWQVRSVRDRIPKALGVDIQQSTEGFSLSKSEGGRTLFTVKASKAVQYKTEGHAELRDVSIVVYGRDSSRYDRIYGSRFAYDPQEQTVSALGEVEIDLEANVARATLPDQAVPKQLKNPVHLRTSGLVFSQKTGIAETDKEIAFQIPQMSGTAQGAVYDSRTNVLTLRSTIRLNTTGDRSVAIVAARGSIRKDPRQAQLEQVNIAEGARQVDAAKVVLDFRDDNSVEHIAATGGVRILNRGEQLTEVVAPRADLEITAENTLTSAELSGGVQMNARGSNIAKGSAGKLLANFGPKNTIRKLRAVDGVKLMQANAGAANKQTVAMETAALDLHFANGTVLDRAESDGAAQVTLVPRIVNSFDDVAIGERRVLSAGKLTADFDKNGQPENIVGKPDAKVAFYTPGQPDRISTSRELVAKLQPSGGLTTIKQQGEFKYLEQSPGAAPVRTATADRATYTAASELIAISGNPRVVDQGLSISADNIRLNRKTGEGFAQGDVKTTYSELRAQPGGAMLASGEPIHVTAETLTVERKTSVAKYSGGSRLWQGANIVEASAIEFDRDRRSVVAQGGGKRVSCVFVQEDKAGRQTPVVITAARLSYVDQQRRAFFSGGVIAKGADVTVNADQVEVVLLSRDAGAKQGSEGPSQLNSIIASGHVSIQQPSRRATGEKLVYTADESKFVLTGGPPLVADAQRGTIRGESLTFYSRDDRVLVESSGNTRTVTRTRVSR